MLETSVNIINRETDHQAKILFTGGCGVYLTIDGEVHEKRLGNGFSTGISNKQAYDILHGCYKEIEAI
jgi:hypothetical protein